MRTRSRASPKRSAVWPPTRAVQHASPCSWQPNGVPSTEASGRVVIDPARADDLIRVLDSDSVVRRLFIAAIIAISIGAPVAEMFDRWDQTQKDGNDTEANVVLVALCVGVAFAIGTIVIASRIRALSFTSVGRVITKRVVVRDLVSVFAPIPTVSPPTVLRV